MSRDTFRERDLRALGVTASVESDAGMCTIRMTVDAFDRMVSTVVLPVDEAPWYDQVKNQLADAEDALRDAASAIRWAERDRVKARGAA